MSDVNTRNIQRLEAGERADKRLEELCRIHKLSPGLVALRQVEVT